MYSIVKHFHLFLVVLSIILFQYRYWRQQVFHHPLPKILKILPHGIDTLLLASGITLAVWANYSPWHFDWLLYKLLALVLYIVFGMLAMKKKSHLMWLAYVLASCAVIYMIMAAREKTAAINILSFIP